MTAASQRVEQAGPEQGWFARNHFGVHTALIVLMIIWAIPTLGLFINSFRPASDALAPDVSASSRRTTSHSSSPKGSAERIARTLNSSYQHHGHRIPIFVAPSPRTPSLEEFPGRNILFVVWWAVGSHCRQRSSRFSASWPLGDCRDFLRYG